MLKILHFADAHIDITRTGRHDAQTGLPLRVLDFLNALDVIVDAAVEEKVDLVLFCGDAYRDRTPQPTFQREWGRRMMRLSQARIPTLLIVGNHDLSPATGRAHALQEYETLQIPFIRVASQPALLGSEQLFDLPVQVIALPWVTRSSVLSNRKIEGSKTAIGQDELSKYLGQLLAGFLNELSPELPSVLAGHLSVQGATYGNERSVMLGRDAVLPLKLISDARLDYVALGHIHKAQQLHEKPPVVYSGSIERIDFGEVSEQKYFVMAQVEKGHARFEWCELKGRKFFDRRVELTHSENIQEQLQAALPAPEEMQDAIGRLVVVYPREWEAFIDEPALRRYAQSALEFHFIRRPQLTSADRLHGGLSLFEKSAPELLDSYWQSLGLSEQESQKLNTTAAQILSAVNTGTEPPMQGTSPQEPR
jgi:exonuclease SbcD